MGRDRTLPRRRVLAAGVVNVVGGAVGATLFAGCTLDADRDHAGDDAPREAPLARAPRVAWVFGSGGPRGFVHVGVVEALAELGLAPDLIVGSSAGAVVGALRAAGMAPRTLREMALALQPHTLLELALRGETRLSIAPVGEWVRAFAPQRLLERMPVAMACVAVRRTTRPDGRRVDDVVAFTAGDAGTAVQASIAIEGRFAPVRIRGIEHVDADWHMPLPVRIARALGARRVLAVDASAPLDGTPVGAERFRELDRRKRELVAPDSALADLVLHPDIGYWTGLSREYRERVVEAGRRATLERAEALGALHRG